MKKNNIYNTLKTIGFGLCLSITSLFFYTVGCYSTKSNVPNYGYEQITDKYILDTDKTPLTPAAINISAIDNNISMISSEIENTVSQLVAEEQSRLYSEMPVEDKILYKSSQYGIDGNIALAIARLETGHFTSQAFVYGNNPGGMSVNEVPVIYPTLEAGLEAFISNLANNYFALGLNTPELIGQKYCPINPSWASVVRGLM